MATAHNNTVLLWNLNKKELMTKLKLPNSKQISYLQFLGNSSKLIIGSYQSNTLQLWVEDNGQYHMQRIRNGLTAQPQKIRFKLEDPKHLIISTQAGDAEIFDFSLINE